MKFGKMLRHAWAFCKGCIQLIKRALGKREYHCSFCGKHEDDVVVLINGPGVLICDGCVHSYTKLSNDPQNGEKTDPQKECSFCSFLREMRRFELKFMQQFSVPPSGGRRLFRGVTVCICNDCLDLCNEILLENKASTNTTG